MSEALHYTRTRYASGECQIRGYLADGRFAGEIHFWTDGEMDSLEVPPALRRRGIATALWDEAKKMVPALHHSRSQTPAGRAWAEAEARR